MCCFCMKVVDINSYRRRIHCATDWGKDMNRVRKIILFIIIGFMGIGLVTTKPISADEILDKDYQVLFISSYSESFMSVPDQITGIQSGFMGKNIEMDIEYMDTKQFPEEENIQNFYETLKYKLEHSQTYDTVIVGDDVALQFAMDYQQDLFDGIPIVFFGINDLNRATDAYENDGMTGIAEVTSYTETISIAHKFNQKATKVLAILDGTLTGIGDEKQVAASEARFPNLEFSLLKTSEYTYDEIASRLEAVGDDTIVLFISMTADKNNIYRDLNDQIDFIAKHTKVPVYRASVGGVGQGLLGGRMIDFKEFGKRTADIVCRILEGEDIKDIKMSKDTPYFYCFDYQLIKKYQIAEDLIPKDAVFINKMENPFEQYKQYIWILGIIVGCLIVIALILIIDNLKRRKIQKELINSNDELQAIYEELTASEEELKNQYSIIENHAREASSLYQKYETAISSTNSAVWELHLDTMIIELSHNLEKIIGKSVPLTGNAYEVMKEIIDEDFRSEILQGIRAYIEGSIDEINIQLPVRDEEGYRRWVLIRGTGTLGMDGNINELFGIILNITSEKEREEYVEFFAQHDFLTKLPNRMFFMEVLQNELLKGNKGALMIFDIDDFKSINDTLGHAYGDELLKQVARRLDGIASEKVFIARMGGDEFLILIKGAETALDVESHIGAIRTALTEEFTYNGFDEYINYSMGITFYPKDSNNINQLMMNADTAMYKVKKNGKNNCIFYHEDMKKEIKEKKEIEMVLRQAAKDGDFMLYYQPQVDVRTGEVVGYEALIRMKGYTVSPAVFIPIAEDTGDIIEIGRWVAREAIGQMARWKEEGLGEKTVAINYSGKQLRDHGYVDYVKELLRSYEISPEYLEIEITEGILLENNDHTLAFLQEVKDAGMKIALDDFGTGYSSLSYLTFLPVNKIKLDKSINDKFLDYEDITVMESIISLAHGLNLTITAEGIEEEEKFFRLKECGCDYIQGYLFSKPLIEEDARKLFHHVFDICN